MASDPIVVKFTAKGHRLENAGVFLRQFPGRKPQWGRCQFVFDPEVREYDWLVAYDDLAPLDGERFSTRAEALPCPAENTLFVTMEPSSIKTYGRDFLDQFGVVITSQESWAVPGANAVYTQPALRWFYGDNPENLIDYDAVLQRPASPKSGDLSTVCSSKRQGNTLHAARYEFAWAVKEAIPELSLFGRGVNPINDKADAIDAFRYHITVENHFADHHWTEKLSDAFLGLSLPLYHGCPNLAEYFPEESFLRIDIHNIPQSIQRIRAAVADGEYERRLPAIREARRRVMEEYNLFAVLSREIEARHGEADRPYVPEACGVLLSRHAMRSRSLLHRFRFAAEHYRIRRQHRRQRRAA